MDVRPTLYRRPERLICIVALAGLAAGCTGSISWSDGPAEPRPPDQEEVDERQPDQPEEIPLASPHLRRLTPVQYEHTVRHGLGDIYESKDLPAFSDDIPTIGLTNDPNNLRVSIVNIDSLYQSAQTLARKAADQTPVVADCVEGTGDACFAEILDEIGPRLWRRPLTDEERADLLALREEVAQAPGTRRQQAEFLLQALLLSPNMLFRTELGAMRDGALELTDYELASALSYTFWNAPPDEELMRLAAAGELDDPEVLRAQVERLIADDERYARALTEFFVDYLKLEAIFSKNKSEELGLTPAARASLVEGARRDLRQIFSQPDATLLAPFSTQSFHVDAHSATFFGVPVVSDGYEVVAMPPDERLGILSHPGFLSVHAGVANSGIVKRGVFTLEQLLCVHLGDPPDNISPVDEPPPDFDPERVTTREELHVMHSSQPQCAGCHNIIDPAGFGFEYFDSAGRYRTTEKGGIPIDASGSLRAGDEEMTFADSTEYIETLTSSEALRRCVSKHYLTYVLGEEPSLLEQEAFYASFVDSGGDTDALARQIIATPSFTARTSSPASDQETSDE